ncbi:hypothetical protein JXQ31_17345 [candidate division KSB1 bacterium]|nr:hypothetical protein [candidate division KSB1 bacterium]
MPGLDKTSLDLLDFNFALKRIQVDIQTDFILAPHYNFIFLKASEELCSRTYDQLKSGKYEPELPITMCIPKPRGFTRPGSILQPIDRLIYQSIIDNIAPTVENNIDRTRTFSHILVYDDQKGIMFKPSHESWEQFKRKISEICSLKGYILKSDVANYFERIPQHHLINLLHASGCNSNIINLLEKILLAFREKNSFGIIQGNFSSDLLGNFYLSDLDAFCELNNIPSARFVDDLYMQFNTEAEAIKGLMVLIERLRQNGLHLNEYKSGIRSADSVIKEETELDKIFNEAREEVEQEMRKNAVSDMAPSIEAVRPYGFSINWEIDESDIELDEDVVNFSSVVRLYNSIDDFPEQSDKIEKFCLPILNLMDSDIAIDNSIEGILRKPYMSRVYNAYISSFVQKNNSVAQKLENILDSDLIVTEYQLMYIFAALMKCDRPNRNTINRALRILQNHQNIKEIRAITALFAAKYGNPQQKHSVKLAYESEPSPYVRSAILYASRHFSTPEQRTCIKAWGGHNLINSLISVALKDN